VSVNYLPEHVDAAVIALDLADREAKHLRYTCQTLYAQSIDMEWVRTLAQREDRAEKTTPLSDGLAACKTILVRNFSLPFQDCLEVNRSRWLTYSPTPNA